MRFTTVEEQEEKIMQFMNYSRGSRRNAIALKAVASVLNKYFNKE